MHALLYIYCLAHLIYLSLLKQVKRNQKLYGWHQLHISMLMDQQKYRIGNCNIHENFPK